jgi:hypothetical protein
MIIIGNPISGFKLYCKSVHKKSIMKPFALLIAMILLVFVVNGQQPGTVYKIIDKKTVYDLQSKGVYMVSSGFMVDADGSPRAYNPQNTGIDYLGNAGRPGNWWGLAVDKEGKPYIQKLDDPAPGYYISTTSLQDGTKKVNNPTRYVNSETISYVAIPKGFASDFTKGDIALVVNKKNNKRCFAIFADVGPAKKIGEGSIFLAEQLGIISSPKKGGATKDIIYILIKKSGKGKMLTNEEIDALGKAKLSYAVISELLDTN